MDFIKRLGYFLVGLSIGIVFLTFFFKKKSDETGVSFCYLPNCRTLKDMRSKPIYYSDEIKQLLLEKKLDSSTVTEFLMKGDVDFGNSDTKSKPCRTYLVEGDSKGQYALLTFKNCTDKVLVEKMDIIE